MYCNEKSIYPVIRPDIYILIVINVCNCQPIQNSIIEFECPCSMVYLGGIGAVKTDSQGNVSPTWATWKLLSQVEITQLVPKVGNPEKGLTKSVRVVSNLLLGKIRLIGHIDCSAFAGFNRRAGTSLALPILRDFDTPYLFFFLK